MKSVWGKILNRYSLSLVRFISLTPSLSHESRSSCRQQGFQQQKVHSLSLSLEFFLCIRGVQNIRLTCQPAQYTANSPALGGLLNQVVWVGWVRPLKQQIRLSNKLKHCLPTTTQPAQLIINKQKNIYQFKIFNCIFFISS